MSEERLAGNGELPSADRVVEYMRETAARPMSAGAIRGELKIADGESSSFDSLLESLIQAGRLVRTRDGRFGVPEKMNLIVGSLSCHADGFGFVIPRPELDESDLYIPGSKLGTAMHGDSVVARKEHVRKSGKLEGRIIRVLERTRKQVVGKFSRGRSFGFVEPLDRRMVWDVYIPENEVNGAEPGQIVCAELTAYPEGSRNPEGRVVEVLGKEDDPKIDVEIIIREAELPHVFPDEVLEAAKTVPTEVTDADIGDRTDFRDVPVVTIDGEKAQDFDDAVHVEKLPGGKFRLAVHIADVSAYVPVGSPFDDEARRRGTSVYFPDRVIPMLPEQLSNEICSLKPGVDRLVHSVIMEIDGNGKTLNYELHDGVIRSAARLTYSDVYGALEGDDELVKRHADHLDHLEAMAELCEALRGYRSRRGAIDFDLPEPEVLIDVLSGEVEQILRSERNLAHRIIEEFMIRANEVVASHMTWEGVPTLYRVHEGPDPERVEKFRDFIGGLGLKLGGGKEPKPGAFQRLIEQIEGKPGERVVAYQMLRTMKQAVYDPENSGHFGLASERYGHFTSPIRRYPDLVVHRLLKADRGSAHVQPFDLPVLEGRLPTIALESSKRERNAEYAERRYIDWKKVQFMADKVGDEFEALITSVHSFGFFVELEPYFVEGLVHVSNLNDDYYLFEEDQHRLRGENSGRILALGNRVKVQLSRVDRTRRRLDFALVEGPLDTPLAAAAEKKKDEKAAKGKQKGRDRAEPKDEGDRKGGRRRRRRRRRKSGGAQAKGKDQGKPDERKSKGKEESKEAGKSGDGSRRGRGRGGRGRRGKAEAAPAQEKKEADQGKGRRRGRGRGKRSDGDADAGKREARSRGRGRKGKPGDSGGRSQPGGNGRQAARSGGGGGGNGKGPQQPSGKPEETRTEKKEGKLVNPYLTDL